MTLARIAEILGTELITGQNLERIEITTACGSDLMSDVLCFSKAGSLLLTGDSLYLACGKLYTAGLRGFR